MPALANNLSSGFNYLLRGSTKWAHATKMGACAWVRLGSGAQTLFAQQDSSTSINCWTVYLTSGFVPTLRTYDSAGTISTVSGSAFPRRQRQWMHVGVFSDGTTVYYVLNAVVDSTSGPPTAAGVPPTTVISSIGAHNIGLAPGADSEMYDMRVFTGAFLDAVLVNLPAAMKLAMVGKHCGEQARYAIGKTGFNQAGRVGQDNFTTQNASVHVRRGPRLPVAYQRFAMGRIGRSAGFQTFLQSLSGGMTPGGTVARRIATAAAGSITPSGIIGKRANLSLVGGITPVGIVVRQTKKPASGSVTPGPGALVRQVGKLTAGGITPTGALTKRINKFFTGGVTPAGTLVAMKVVLKAVGGTVAPAGTLVNSVHRLVSGALTPAGTTIKQVTKTFTGGVTPTGTLVALKVFLRAFTGSITPGPGILVRRVGKVMTGSQAAQGVLVSNVRKFLAGVVTSQGAMTRARLLALSGTMSPSAILLELVKYQRSFTGGVTPLGFLSLGNQSIVPLYFDAKLLPAIVLQAELKRALDIDVELN